MVDAQTFIDTNFTDKTITQITNQDLIDKGIAMPGGLTGPLRLEGFTKLEKVEINDGKKTAGGGGLDNDLTELTIVNCPELKEINVNENKLTKLDITKIKTDNGNDTGGPAPTDKLKKIEVGGNYLKIVSLEYCPKLELFLAPGNTKLDEIPGIDRAIYLNSAVVTPGLIRYIISDKLDYYREVVRVVRETLGMSPNDSVAAILSNLKTKIEDKVVSQKNPELQRERDEAKANYDTIKTERDQLKQQLTEIRNELSLEENAAQQKILDKIKELMKRPTSGCSHTDYDNIKAERDRLTSEVESKKRRISELENENKENVDGINTGALRESAKTHLEKLGVKVLDDSKLQNATTAQNVERIRNEIISSEFSKLKDENKSSFYLNLGLGAIALGSLIFIAWMVMRQNDLSEKEPEKKKEK